METGEYKKMFVLQPKKRALDETFHNPKNIWKNHKEVKKEGTKLVPGGCKRLDQKTREGDRIHLSLQGQGEAVSDWQHAQINPLVMTYFFIEGTNRLGALISMTGSRHTPAPKYIVYGYQPTRT